MSAPVLIACPNLSLDRTIAVEALAPGYVHRSTRTDARGGGKGVNVARALGCVGVTATVVGLVAGRTGEAVSGMLEDEGLDAHVVPCEGETRSCLTVLSEGYVTVFNESGPALSRRSWEEFEARVTRALSDDAVFVCSGSFPPGSPADGAARLLDAARARGCTTICDTSRAQLEEALAGAPDLVVPNLAEALGVLEGARGEPVEAGDDARARGADAARALVERGSRAAVVTLGAAGAVSWWEGRARHWAAPAVAVVNPVGAGDALVAGFAWGLSEGAGLDAAMQRGVALAAASCETFPAGLLDRDRYERLLRLHEG